MSAEQLDLPESGEIEETSDGKTDLQRLMDKNAEDYTQADIKEICRILRDRRDKYCQEELEKAAKPKKEPKPKAEPKAKPLTKAQLKAQEAVDKIAASGLDEDLLGDLL